MQLMLNKAQIQWVKTNFNKLAKANKDEERQSRFKSIANKADQSKGILVIGKTDARAISMLAKAMSDKLKDITIPEYKRRGKAYVEYMDKAIEKVKNLDNMVKLIKAKIK